MSYHHLKKITIIFQATALMDTKLIITVTPHIFLCLFKKITITKKIVSGRMRGPELILGTFQAYRFLNRRLLKQK